MQITYFLLCKRDGFSRYSLMTLLSFISMPNAVVNEQWAVGDGAAVRRTIHGLCGSPRCTAHLSFTLQAFLGWSPWAPRILTLLHSTISQASHCGQPRFKGREVRLPVDVKSGMCMQDGGKCDGNHLEDTITTLTRIIFQVKGSRFVRLFPKYQVK